GYPGCGRRPSVRVSWTADSWSHQRDHGFAVESVVRSPDGHREQRRRLAAEAMGRSRARRLVRAFPRPGNRPGGRETAAVLARELGAKAALVLVVPSR